MTQYSNYLLDIKNKLCLDIVNCSPHPLSHIKPKLGAGLYLLYYEGSYHLYNSLVRHNQNVLEHIPIYVGIAGDGRTSNGSKDKYPLNKRLINHKNNINLAENLNIEDFFYRYVELDYENSSLISCLERIAIQKYKPIWNNILSGFGSREPSSQRANGKKSVWDEIHPGRKFALQKTSQEGIKIRFIL